MNSYSDFPERPRRTSHFNLLIAYGAALLYSPFKRLSAQERHQLRIALKKLRYTAEFFRSLYQKKREKAYFHALAQLQNSLGHMNDIVVADHLLERLSAARDDRRISDRLSTAAGIVAGWYTQSASSSEHQAEASWREFCRCDAFW